jgi:hypothetical protein
LNTAKLIIAVLLLLGLAGCAKRQSNIRLVYVPSQPPAASGSAQQGGVVVIQKPAPAQPSVAETKPERVPEPVKESPPTHEQRVARKEIPTPPTVNPKPATSDAPPLEPANISQEQASIQRSVNMLEQGVQARINRLSRQRLAGADRKTLEDARTFIAQSEDAKKRGDLSQASNLVQKADLLVQAVEKRY